MRTIAGTKKDLNPGPLPPQALPLFKLRSWLVKEGFWRQFGTVLSQKSVTVTNSFDATFPLLPAFCRS